jgi:hypothetical protein
MDKNNYSVSAILAKLSVIVLITISPIASAEFSISYERALLTREFGIENAVSTKYDGASNSVAASYRFASGKRYSSDITVKYIDEDSSSEEVTQEFSMRQYALEYSIGKITTNNSYFGTVVGLTGVTYEAGNALDEDYFGYLFGLSGAAPILTNRLFITGSFDLNILSKDDNSDGRNTADIKGIKGDVALAYVLTNTSFRLGYKRRLFSGDEESDLQFEDNVSGYFVSIRHSFR